MIGTILIIIAVLLASLTHILSAIKSGCFYNAMRQMRSVENFEKPKPLAKFIDNMHYVQTPFWYSLFGCLTIMCFLYFSSKESIDIETSEVFYDLAFYIVIIKSFMLGCGASALVSPLYQGYINVGAGKPFVDTNEKDSMELANPISNKTVWIKRFWHGKARFVASFFGLILITVALIFM